MNVRDLGGISVQAGTLKHNLFLRGGADYTFNQEDWALVHACSNLTLSLDLRTAWEREERPPRALSGVEMRHIPLYDKDIVGVEYTRSDVDVGDDPYILQLDLFDYYQTSLNPLTVGQMAKALNAAFENALAGNATYIHCTNGKDRSGMVGILLLTILGAARADILADYQTTNAYIESHCRHTAERCLQYGLSEEQAQRTYRMHFPREEYFDTFLGEIDKRYGSMEQFIRNQLNITEEYRCRIIDACVDTAYP